jgi:3-dehydroquinate dehydratase/shikimate dehydrogenase
MERAEGMADCIEIRLDLVPREVWTPLLRRRKKPCIIALRPERQGGEFQGEEISRIQLLAEALNYCPDFIDMEWDMPPHLFGSLMKKKSGKTGVIVSYHNLTDTPYDIESISKRLGSRGGDILKIVTWARDLSDNVRILKFVERQSAKTIAFCMGPFGVPSRVLTLRSGGFLTFGALDAGKESAPGQIPAKDLTGIYRAGRIHRRTRVFGLIGNPVSHSLSPCIHNPAFEVADFDGVYVPFQVRDLGNLIHDLSSLGVEGFSVTIPHKEGVISLLNRADGTSRKIGAVNTVYREGGQWLGTNTDVYGAWKALETTGLDLRGKRWTVIGAGGVARAIAYGAGVKAKPKSLTLVGRTPERLECLLGDLRRTFSAPLSGTLLAETDLKEVLEETDILVNGTPVGMAPAADETPVPSHFLQPRHLVFDTVYNPIETRLLREAGERGCQTVSGFQMFLFQGAAQFERWTGKKAPLQLMEQKAKASLAC